MKRGKKAGKRNGRVAPLEQIEEDEKQKNLEELNAGEQETSSNLRTKESQKVRIKETKTLVQVLEAESKDNLAASKDKNNPENYDEADRQILELYEELGEEEPTKTEEDSIVPEHFEEGQFYTDPSRPKWSSDIDFLLSIIGFAVDISNIWNFPYLVVTNGGAAFLIPYAIILATCGVPIFYMELLLGQFVKQGCISVWRICPLFKGLGMCMCAINYLTSFYYNVIMAWSLVYVYESSFSPLKWTQCGDASNHKDNYWASSNCTSALDFERDESNNSQTRLPNSATEFFNHKILEYIEIKNKTSSKKYSISELGHPDDSLAVILLFVYTIMLLVLVFGIRITGKVVWVTATVPYLILGILLFRGITLPGSREGLTYFLNPDFSKLGKMKTWNEAGRQVFYSLGTGFGIHLTLATFNDFHHNLLNDCIITALVNSFTSLLGGLVVFAFIGNMAYSLRTQVSQLAERTMGPQLVFEIFPQAIGRLPGANFFAMIFYIMAFMIGIDTTMCGMQSVQIAFIDNFRVKFNQHAHSREVFMFILLIVSFLVSLSCVTRGGIFVFVLLDHNAASVSLIFAALLQCIAIGWIYGTKNLADGVLAMTGKYPCNYCLICWKFITPIFLVALLLFQIDFVFSEKPQYEGREITGLYYVIGICIALLPSLSVPLVAFMVFRSMKSPSFKNKFLLAISPEHEHEEILETGIASRAHISHYLTVGFKCDKKVAKVRSQAETNLEELPSEEPSNKKVNV